jgi:hypothetical protein
MLKWPPIVAEQPIALEAPMSALGQKQTFCSAIAMSALPPKADIRDALAVSALRKIRPVSKKNPDYLQACHLSGIYLYSTKVLSKLSSTQAVDTLPPAFFCPASPHANAQRCPSRDGHFDQCGGGIE